MLKNLPRSPFVCFFALSILGLLPATCWAQLPSGYRQPTAITFDQSEQKLLLANAKSGSVSVVDIPTQKIVETKMGKSIRDIVLLQNSNFLCVDFHQHELMEFGLDNNDQVKIVARTSVERYPQCIAVNDDQTLAFVSSLWSRRITCLHRGAPGQPFQKLKHIDFDFAPREMVYLAADEKLVVADNFNGKLAVVDCNKLEIESVHNTSGHNFRGLGLTQDGQTIVVANQMLNELAHTSRNDIHWGLLMSNDLRWIEKDAFLTQDSELYKSSHMHPLGKEDHAAGDPGRLAIAKDKTVVVTISGTNEVAFGKEDDFWLKRHTVGKRPVDVVIDSNSQFAYIANAHDDSVSVFDLKQEKVTGSWPLGKQRELTAIEKGEQLFFDASLSHDGWMSCHSCHTDGHTNGGLNDNFTDGSFGAPKMVLSLLGRRGTEPLAWNGLTKDFETQVKNSITSTMKSKDDPDQKTVDLLAGYLRTLKAPPSLAAARDELDANKVAAGKKIFEVIGCAACHKAPLYTSPEVYDVGFEDEENNTEFNPPSLLGVSQRNAYFHDGRAKTLEEVVGKFKHKVRPDTSEADLKLLIQFLRSL